MKYLLDTNIISELISKKPNLNVINFISCLDEKTLYLSVITIGEIKFGIEILKSSSKKQSLIKWFEKDLMTRFKNKIIDIDTSTMLIWANENQKLKSVGRPLPIMDTLIASTCMANDFILLTRNEKDFMNLDLKIINPFNA